MDRAEGSIDQQLNLPTNILFWTSRSSTLFLKTGYGILGNKFCYDFQEYGNPTRLIYIYTRNQKTEKIKGQS
ncbi:hypothetical protein F511_10625 [Dorcoceras hygrometricum]|uniref:Uncharacterized protein n=1 Tax=Dorcoceras hygrometricum TaxID=472368 RepID=A0A2Z7CHN1_9LAMI|nr:hypothetical protein F511_10625 [Dorcoceras hygrometricum]